ncbi:MAG: hypothetical protein ABNH53_01450 [Henriciella sp.]|jgi:hypothetical protein
MMEELVVSRDETLAIFDRVVAASVRFERKGKTMPYTSANGHMFSQVNKDGQLGIRLPKCRQTDLLAEHGAGPFKSYGATMRDYVCLTEDMLAGRGFVG